MVLVQVTLGVGFGLLFTPLLVGMQSVVGWDQCSFVTGTDMFSRYLGQSFGAALFGVIFNAALADRFAEAPASIAKELPQNFNDIIGALHDNSTGAAADAYLRHTVDIATHHLFVGLAVIGVLVRLILFVAPRHYSMFKRDKL